MDQNVKMLLEAEQTANEQVRQAIMYKQEKLKEAKVKAEQEIQKFQAEKEAEFEAEKRKRYGDGVNLDTL